MRQLLRLTALVLALVLVAAACGSDNDAETTSSETTETASSEAEPEEAEPEEAEPEEAEPEEAEPEEAEPEEAEPEEAEPAAADGEPILIGFLGTSGFGLQTSWDALNRGIDAATDRVNESGGVNGRPIEVLRCDDGGDPNRAAECAQELIDAGVVTFIGNMTSFGEASNPIIVEAGMSVISGALLTPADFAVEQIYATNGGPVGASASPPLACSLFGAETIGLAYLDVPVGQQVPEILSGFIMGPNNLELTSTEAVALDTADFAPLAAKVVSDNPDCWVSGLLDIMNPAAVAAVRSAGYEGLIGLSGTFMTPEELVNNLGENTEDIVLGYLYDHNSPGWFEFVDAVADYGDGSEPTELGVIGWLGVFIAADVIAVTGDDPAAITAGIPEIVVDYDTNGLTLSPLDWSTPGDNPLGIQNIRDFGVAGSLLVDGEPQFSEAGWVNMFGDD